MSKRYTNVGIIRVSTNEGKSNAPFATLGNPTAKDPKYVRNVEVRVTDGNGVQVAYAKNPLLSIQDPRTNPGRTQEQIARIPTWLLKELVLIEDNNT